MARVQVNTQHVDNYMLTPTMTTPTVDGDSIEAGNVLLFIENQGNTDQTVTVLTPATVRGLDVEQLTVTAPGLGQVMIGPFPPSVFARPVSGSDPGRVWVDYQTPADLVRAVFTW